MRDWRRLLALAFVLLGGVACAYRSVVEPGLCRDRSIRTRPFAQSRVVARDVEGVVYVAEDDQLWIADDNSNQVYVIDRQSGAYRGRLRVRDFVSAFPQAGRCDDSDGNPATSCSYTQELEALAYDPTRRSLLVVNTVNDPRLDPPVDKPAIYRLRKREAAGNFQFDEWKELALGHHYDAIVSIRGRLYVSLGDGIAEYDYEQNRFVQLDPDREPVRVFRSRHGTIAGMAWDGSSLWVLSRSAVLSQVDWGRREEIGSWDVSAFRVGKAKGLAVGLAEFFVVDGDPPNSIHVLHFEVAPRFSRAGWLGGWPRSCPGR